MGICIFVPGADYSARNLGTAMLVNILPIEAIAIVGPNETFGAQEYLAKLFPIFTTQRGVSWSIVSGAAYATISSSGIVTPASDVISQPVTIRCSSVDNPAVYAEKTISVTDDAALPTIGTTIKFDGLSAIDTGIPASMPTEIQVTMAQLYPANWSRLSNSWTSTLIGGRASSSSKRRDIQLQALNTTTTISRIVFGVGGASKDVVVNLSPENELYLAQGPTFYQYNNTRLERGGTDTFESSAHYIIGAQNNDGTLVYTYGSHDKYKRVKIYDTEGGTLLRDLVPATQNGVPGMWDYVSQTFFTNIGTGTLIVE